jgi:exonuclease III
MSCYKSNSAGVLTIYSKNYETEYEENDNLGRKSFLVIKNNSTKLIIVNIYVPNDHKEAITFIEDVYSKIIEIQNRYPEHYVIIGGDMNVCLTKEDCLNRNWGTIEKILSDNIKSNNKAIKLVDTYRCINKKDGYTWNRGNCYSRLDHIFSSDALT